MAVSLYTVCFMCGYGSGLTVCSDRRMADGSWAWLCGRHAEVPLARRVKRDLVVSETRRRACDSD